MAKWIVKYTDANGDLSSVWVEAETPAEAKNIAYREYWDIEDVVMVKQALYGRTDNVIESYGGGEDYGYIAPSGLSTERRPQVTLCAME